MKEIAKAYFLGKKGPRRNCAQSVAEALQEKFPCDKETAVLFSTCGGGKAPEGYCGSFYAAKCILERYFPHRLEAGMEQLRVSAGSLKCLEIKTLKKLPCVGCVEKAVEVIEGQ